MFLRKLVVGVLCLLAMSACEDPSGIRPGYEKFYSLEKALQHRETATWLYLNDIGDSLSPQIGQLTRLEDFAIAGSPLRFIPQEFSNLDSLTRAYFFGVAFEDFPPQLLGCPKLRVISITDASIRSLPETLSSFNLVSFDLANNELDSIPHWLTHSNSVNTLGLEHKKIANIDIDASAFPKTVNLNLTGNLLDRITVAKYASPKVTALLLGGNRLTEFPIAVGAWNNLERLHLEDNQITDFKVVPGAFPKQEVLKLTGNPIPEQTVQMIRQALPNTKVDF